MTRPQARLRQIPRQSAETRLKPPSILNDVDRVERALRHRQEPATRKLKKRAAQDGTGQVPVNANGSNMPKWPKGPVTAGIVAATLLLWVIIIGGTRFILA